MTGAHARAHHNGHRRRQAQSAGAGNYQHRNGHGQGKGEILSHGEPDNQRYQRNAHHHGDKNPTDLVRQFGNGSLGCRRFLHQMDNLHQGGILPHLLRFQYDGTRLVHAACNQAVTRFFVHGYALTGNGRLIHRRAALQQKAIHRNALAGLHLYPLP